MPTPFRIAVWVAVLGTSARADDWPQWMGVQRDNVWREQGIVETLPKGEIAKLWRTKIGGGYAGPAVAQGRVYVTDLVTPANVKVDNFTRGKFSGTERVLCLDEATGKELWKHSYPATYTISYPAGPRCTPVVHDGKVYTLGAEGNLLCFAVATGKVLWEKDFKKEYGTKSALWGYASHPLVDGNKLICVVGGKGSHTVAFDKDTGAELWRALTAKEQGYSPPTIVTAGGVRQLLSFRPDAVGGLDPETGKEYWSLPYGATSGSVIMAPIVSGNLLFVAGYSQKNLMVKLAADRPAGEILWRDTPKIAMSPVNVQPFLEDGILYGFHETGELRAVKFDTGEILWRTTKPIAGGRAQGSETAFIVHHRDRFVLFNELGQLIFCKMSAKEYAEDSRCDVLKPTNNAFGRQVLWCAPAFANKRMYVRNDEEIVCVDLAAR